MPLYSLLFLYSLACLPAPFSSWPEADTGADVGVDDADDGDDNADDDDEDDVDDDDDDDVDHDD